MRAPACVTGYGALGFWAAVRDVWSETREERCWVHKIANVLDKLPKSVQPKAKSLLHEAKYPKAADCLQGDREKLVAHFDFPADHWKHLRTTNPIESTFATVKLRQRVTKGAGSRKAGLAMALKLLLAAESTWRRLNGHELLPLVRAGVRFRDGVRVERDDAMTNNPHIRKGRTKRDASEEKDAA